MHKFIIVSTFYLKKVMRFKREEIPIIVSVAFWASIVLSGALGFIDSDNSGFTLLIQTLVILVLWSILPWQQVRGFQIIIPILFFIFSMSFGLFSKGSVVFLSLLLVAFANLRFSLGLTPSIIALLASLTFIGLSYALQNQTFDITGFIRDSGSIALLGLFAIVLADTTIRERHQRDVAEDLLKKVEELTLSEERARMARDMHDSLGHSLTVIKLSAEACIEFQHRGYSDQLTSELVHIREITEESIRETRLLARSLKPTAIRKGINENTLRDLAASFQGAGVDIDYYLKGNTNLLPQEIQLVSYRVIQESLVNAFRHSNPKYVSIKVLVMAQRVTIVVENDGNDSNDYEEINKGGFGLSSLKERVESLGGELSVGSQRTDNFLVECNLPLPIAVGHKLSHGIKYMT